MQNKYSVPEDMIKTIIKYYGAKGLAIAINNACAHGEVFLEADLNLGDDDVLLNSWFKGVETLLDVGKKIDR
jgi:hypothetical protein